MCFFYTSVDQGLVSRKACRFRCGASFIIPTIIGFLGWDVEDSLSSRSADEELGSYSSSESGMDEDSIISDTNHSDYFEYTYGEYDYDYDEYDYDRYRGDY